MPRITISPEGDDNGDLTQSSLLGSIKQSVSTENISKKKDKKKKKQTGPEMPPATVITMKSILYQKATLKWDKRWCVFTADKSLYIAASETSTNALSVMTVTTDSKVVRKNGPDKYPHAVMLNCGGKKELLATENQSDFDSWISLLETAAGVAQIQELLSEDEEDGG